MILRATEKAIQGVLRTALDADSTYYVTGDLAGLRGPVVFIPLLPVAPVNGYPAHQGTDPNFYLIADSGNWQLGGVSSPNGGSISVYWTCNIAGNPDPTKIDPAAWTPDSINTTGLPTIHTIGGIPVYLSDSDAVKEQMPYIVIICSESEEEIGPGSGIFKVSGELHYRSHTKETSPEERQTVLDLINNFAYDSTAAKLSGISNFHCHGWQPTQGKMTPEPETKSVLYSLKYWVHCMAMDNS